jgi:hypothetical protein
MIDNIMLHTLSSQGFLGKALCDAGEDSKNFNEFFILQQARMNF